MIKFFRKIRQRLLSENKFSKYFLYAIGEIILVVIGILIALQINNWNDGEKNKKIEQQLLTSLLEEFQANLKLLDTTIQTNKRIYDSALKIGEFTGPSLSDFEEKELSILMVKAFKYDSKFIPNQGTINEITNSGKLSLITDRNLRKAFSEWQAQLALVHDQEAFVMERRDICEGYFIDNGNFRRHLVIIEDPLLDATPSRFPNNDFRFLETQEFESNLYLFIVASINLNKEYYFPLRKQTEALIQQIGRNIE